MQSKLTERAVELLSLPNDGAPKLLLDVGCGSGLSGEQLTDMVSLMQINDVFYRQRTSYDISSSKLCVRFY